MVPTHYFLILSAILFGLGAVAFCFRRTIITIFMSIDLIVNAVAVGSTGLAFLCALEAVREFFQLSPQQIPWVKQYFSWIVAGNFRAGFDLQIDQLTVVMLLVVTGVGWLIHIYSTGYMAHGGGYYRFFSYLNLFMFFMLILVLASNYVLLFVGWEGVGLCSYLLIGFYFLRKSAADAGKKAFIVNRIGFSQEIKTD